MITDRSNAKAYIPRDGDTLEKIAERERGVGNDVTAAAIARFNFGTDDPASVDEHLRDELGCYQRDADNRFVISADATGRSELQIPRVLQPTFKTNRVHTFVVRRKFTPPQFLDCASVDGLTFPFDQSFLRPTVVDALDNLAKSVADYPDAKVLIFGHTDNAGSDEYNKKLSERRAWSVHSFILNDTSAWETLYNMEEWGLSAIQEILVDLGYDPGNVAGENTTQTKQAVEAFQADQTIQVDGAAGPQTREKLFAAYMSGKHDIDLPPEQFLGDGFMGCGEFNPLVDSEEDAEANRRVTLYLFDPDRTPHLPCQLGKLAPCQKQMSQPDAPRHRDSFRCSFYDSIAKDCPCEGPGVFTRLEYHVYLEPGADAPGFQADGRITLRTTHDDTYVKSVCLTNGVEKTTIDGHEFLLAKFEKVKPNRRYDCSIDFGGHAENEAPPTPIRFVFQKHLIEPEPSEVSGEPDILDD